MHISSWSRLEEELVNHIDNDGGLRFDAVQKLPLLSFMSDDDVANAAAFEMLSQWNTPYVVAAGFEYVVARSPDKALDAALTLLASKPPECSIIPFAHAIELLETAQPSKTTDTVIGKFGRRALTYPQDSMRFVVLTLPAAALGSWFEGSERNDVPASFESAVIAKLLDDGDPTVSQDVLTNRLRRLGGIPGLPRAYYVLHASLDAPASEENVRSVLEDKTIGWELVWLCAVRNAQMIREVGVDNLNVSTKRRELIRRATEAENTD